MRYTGYIKPTKYTGYITVDVWDNKDSMYPVLYNQKFDGYTISEIKKYIRDKLGVTRMQWVID